MATKLASSLRKSISAEKVTVEEKLSDTNVQIAEIKPITPQKVAQPKVEATKVTEPTPKNVPQVEVVTNTKSKPAPDTLVIDFFTKSNHTLAAINATLGAVQSINQDINAYTHSALNVTSFSDLYKLNSELLTKLRLRQQKLIEENLEIFSRAFKQM